MDELVRWLGKQLDEDERIAKDAIFKASAAVASADRLEDNFKPPYDGSVWGHDYDHIYAVEQRPGRRQKVQIADCGSGAFMLTPHIAEHDPARVLREIDAKRRIVECHEPWTASNGDIICGRCGREHIDGRSGGHFPCQTLRLLALPYADRPGYREEWAP